MRYLTVLEVLELHRRAVAQTGGDPAVRDLGALEAAVAQPRQTFGGVDLYPTVVDKAAALGFFLVSNHPFVDGNKRTGYVALLLMLRWHAWEIAADIDEQERIVLQLAAGELDRETFTAWVRDHVVERTNP